MQEYVDNSLDDDVDPDVKEIADALSVMYVGLTERIVDAFVNP